MNALAGARRLDACFALFDRCAAAGVPLDYSCYAPLLAGCAVAGDRGRAKAVKRAMKVGGVRRGAASHGRGTAKEKD